MIQLSQEIKAKMRAMQRIHATLALVSAALLWFSLATARQQALTPFGIILLLNLIGIALLHHYKGKEKFP